MGFVLSELEQGGPVTGLAWQTLAKEVVQQANAGPGSNALERVLRTAEVQGWTVEQRDYLSQTYESRGLNDLGQWYPYMNANTRRLSREEAFDVFQQTVDRIHAEQGQVHPDFRIDSLFLFGSFLRPYRPERPYGDIDFMAEWAWTGDSEVPTTERIRRMNQWLRDEPFGEFATIGMVQYGPGEAQKQGTLQPEDRTWQILQVWERDGIAPRWSQQDRAMPDELERLFQPLSREDLALLHELETETCALQRDGDWRSAVLPYVNRVKNQQHRAESVPLAWATDSALNGRFSNGLKNIPAHAFDHLAAAVKPSEAQQNERNPELKIKP